MAVGEFAVSRHMPTCTACSSCPCSHDRHSSEPVLILPMNGIDVLIGIQPVYLKNIYVCVFHTSIDCKAHTFHNLTTKHNLTLKSGCVIYSHAQITTDSFFLFLGGS